MRALYVTCLASTTQTAMILAARSKDAERLPTPVLDEKMHQYAMDTFVHGHMVDMDSWDLFYSAAKLEALPGGLDSFKDAPAGSVQVRVEYDSNYGKGDADAPNWTEPQVLWSEAQQALNHPYSGDHNTPGLIDHIRITVAVGDGRTFTRTLWPYQAPEEVWLKHEKSYAFGSYDAA